jgi:PknH-like extracellular domain
VTAVVSLVTLSAGCGSQVDGAAEPAAKALKVLPTEDEITAAVGNGLSTFDFRPFVGGPEILPDGFRTNADASPIACIGVTDTTMRVVYEATPMVEAARQSYFTLNQSAAITGADAAVIRMAPAAGAQRVFDDSVRQWRSCADKIVDKHIGGASNAEVLADISDVAVTGPLLSATLHTRPRPDGPTSAYQRVLGVRSDTIVEVSLAVTSAAESGSAARAAAVARAMLDKV